MLLLCAYIVSSRRCQAHGHADYRIKGNYVVQKTAKSVAKRRNWQDTLKSTSFITNRDLLLVRLLAHFLLLYLWVLAPVLSAVRVYVANLKAVFPSSVLELQVLWRFVIIAVNHRIADACTEDTTSHWMQDLIVAPSFTYTVWLALTGGHSQ